MNSRNFIRNNQDQNKKQGHRSSCQSVYYYHDTVQNIVCETKFWYLSWQQYTKTAVQRTQVVYPAWLFLLSCHVNQVHQVINSTTEPKLGKKLKFWKNFIFTITAKLANKNFLFQ